MGKKKESQKATPDAETEKKQLKGRGGAVEKSSRGTKAAAPLPSFRLPEPDRVVHLSAPAVLPPAAPDDGAADAAEEELGDDGEEMAGVVQSYEGALPKKLQLGHLSLLTHPVTINAIDNFLSEDECRTWIAWGEARGFQEAKQKQNALYAHRDNGRIEFRSADHAHLLWLRIRPFVPEAVPTSDGKGKRQALGCSPRIRVYRYNPGQRFGKHIDGSVDEPDLGGRTHFTVLVYLNGGERDPPELRVKGGETIFWKDHDGRRLALAFPPTRGACLFHGHGDECMTHEGAAVEGGVKYVLRTDVVYELEE